MRTRITELATAALISMALAGCVASEATTPAASASTSPSPSSIGLGVVNATELAVSLFVNGSLIETLAPGSANKAIYLSALPRLPWLIEARTSSGRILVSMTVDASELSTRPADATANSGKLAVVDLSCGRLSIWTGASEAVKQFETRLHRII